MKFEHVLVVGAGQMGGGIAQVVAASGRRVSLHDPFPGAVERGLEAMRKSLDEARRPTSTRRWRACSRSTSSSPADLLIEAIVEDPAAKEELFRRADDVLPDGRDPRLEHELDPDHVARRGHADGRSA